jgi:pimeloyl-ACP methyl ester carboxylesterase
VARGTHKVNLRIDVAGCAPAGCTSVSADFFVPDEYGSSPILWCCVPGGGISRAYFDLDVPAAGGAYSMARFAADRGQLVLTIDPPGVGESDRPDDGYALTPRVVADVLHHAVTEVIRRVEGGEIDGLPAVTLRMVLGVGHSAGGLLVACQQGRHRTFGATALLGFSAHGLPAVLTDQESTYAARPEELVNVLPELVRARFGDPLPEWSNSHAAMAHPDPQSEAIAVAMARADTRLLALVGMSALIPGSIQPEMDMISVPTFVALGDDDIAGDITALPGQLPGCHDLTLITLVGTGHNHNAAETRFVLWHRLLRWVHSIAPPDAADQSGRSGRAGSSDGPPPVGRPRP